MKFWKKKKVLVTGSEGFIGSHLTEALVQAGAVVRAMVYYNSFDHKGWLNSFNPKILRSLEIFPGDIRDPIRTKEAVNGVDIVFHLASLIGIPYSYHAPDSYVQTNVMGGLNVFNACRECNIERLIHTSTSEVYGTAQYTPIDEKHPLQGQSPYSASKISADMLAESFYRSFNLPVTIIRPFNTYGPRQSGRAVIPTIMSQLLDGIESICLGALTPTRDLNYVSDTVAGFLTIASSEKAIGHVVNIGSGREISIGNLVHIIMEITGRKAEVISEESRLRPKQSEVQRLVCDNALAKDLAGWTPQYTLEQGLEETYNWMKENLGHYRPSEYTL